jgi:hypothetical protein
MPDVGLFCAGCWFIVPCRGRACSAPTESPPVHVFFELFIHVLNTQFSPYGYPVE